MALLRLVDRVEGAGHVVELALEGLGARRTAWVRFDFGLTARDREDVRWYLEDYLQYPVDPAPDIAARVESRLAELGAELFRLVFEANRDTMKLWDAIAGRLSDCRVEVATGPEGTAGVPWELLRDPATDGALALRTRAFVRTLAEASMPVAVPEVPETLRVLLVICRPGGPVDVPFRSVASHLVRLSREARDAFQLEVLRPPTFAMLTRALQAAKAKGEPYHVVHFDGHGAWLSADAVAAGAAGGFDRERFSLLSPPRPGSHGYLVFEDRSTNKNQLLVDGPALGQLLVDADVPVLVLNACRSAHADLVTAPETEAAERDAHQRVRAYGSLAQEVMDAGVAGVVAMGYNVYVVTAARFIGDVYAELLAGRELGQAVAAARRQLAASPLRQVSLEPRPLQDWLVPLVFEAAPLALRAVPETQPELAIDLSQDEAGRERARLDPVFAAEPDVGFFGRDETLLALDRAFDTGPVVLLHAWAGAGKTSTALEFARWYALTGAVGEVLFTSFTRHLPLARLLDQIGDRFGPALAAAGVEWAALDDAKRRSMALQVLTQAKMLWVWDNVEPVAGFPAKTLSSWTQAEQDELAAFLRDLAQRGLGCKVLLTSRRDEQGWLGDLPARVGLPPMPMLERLELAKAVAARQTGTGQRFLDVKDWRPLLMFTQGNPLTLTVLTRQALRDRRTTSKEIEAFVQQLRAGAAKVTDDDVQGRGASLAASLDYGFSHAFSDTEHAILALMALFQGFIDVDALREMGAGDSPVHAVAGLDRDRGIALLDQAAEVGLLTPQGGGYYTVHPAIPWHLRNLFEQHYGPPGSPRADEAIRAWTRAISGLGHYWLRWYGQGHTEAVGMLGLEENNLLQARQLARDHGWWGWVIGSMQGLRGLYYHTGQAKKWQGLVDELIPDFTNPSTGGPLAGREEDWDMLTSYRARIAREARDWQLAQQLQRALLAWRGQQAADPLTVPPEKLSEVERNTIRDLALAHEQLGHILREQQDPTCVEQYLEGTKLCQRIDDRDEEAVLALNLGHAYASVSRVRNLDKAEHWYRRNLELLEEHDFLGRAKALANFGGLAHRRFYEAREAGGDADLLFRYLAEAADAYQESLSLVPPDDIDQLAVNHNGLAGIYANVGDTERALYHLQQAIQYYEREGKRYRAGQSRQNAAIFLADAGRRERALLYARAALRDYEAVGQGAAAAAEQARRLITQLEREPSE